jgi:hypothetical protein
MTKPANDEAYIIFVAFSMTMNIFWRKEYASNTKTLITPKNDLNTQMRDERVLMQGYIKRNKKRQSPKKLSNPYICRVSYQRWDQPKTKCSSVLAMANAV